MFLIAGKDHTSLEAQRLRKPEWLKVKLPHSKEYKRVKGVLSSCGLHSVCQEARCPNMTECFHGGTATFLILGDVCTRSCAYCNIRSGIPGLVDHEEPERLADAVMKLGLQYVVITSVTRDDLPDGGAELFARCVESLRYRIPDCKVEVLIPDFRGSKDALDRLIRAGPDVINHNMEVVRSLFTAVRPQGNYGTSLKLLQDISGRRPPVISKSGFMIGLGETMDEILGLLADLSSVDCKRVTIGQYQQPTRTHWPVHKYYHPDEFEELKIRAGELGIRSVEAGPLVRSSYHAAHMK
ncbi:MAG TPA: lipoyl synthase [Deltaproteobacteria bacterium]|nr:lipoyl synthase [Deltaproteobacteria bacterium]